MSVGTRGRADNDYLPSYMLADVIIRFLHSHCFLLDGSDLDIFVIDRKSETSVNYVESELRIQSLPVSYVNFRKSHLFGYKSRGSRSSVVVFYGKSKAHLNLSVVHSVAVRFKPGFIENR